MTSLSVSLSLHPESCVTDSSRRCGWNVSSALVPPGDDFRTQRKLMTKLLGPNAVKKTFAVTEELSRQTIMQLADEGGNVHELVKLYVSPWINTPLN